MNKILNIETWKRKEHFQFFSQFKEPFFGITAEVDCTNAHRYCKENNHSFFLYYHHKAITAVNSIEEFRYRIHNDDILIYDTIHTTTTISRDDNTFAFTFFPFKPAFSDYAESAQTAISEVKKSGGLGLSERSARLDVIHFTTIPWIHFTGITHARDYKENDSVPKIAFGKYIKKDGKITMPVSVHVHHGLMDGFHVGKFFNLFEELLNGSF